MDIIAGILLAAIAVIGLAAVVIVFFRKPEDPERSNTENGHFYALLRAEGDPQQLQDIAEGLVWLVRGEISEATLMISGEDAGEDVRKMISLLAREEDAIIECSLSDMGGYIEKIQGIN